MMRRLGGTNRSLAAIAALLLPATVAFAGAMSGCGSSNNNNTSDSGSDVSVDSPSTRDSGTDSPVTDSAPPPVDSPPPVNQCGIPTITPNGGAVAIGSTVTIAGPAGFPTTALGGNIYFTTDGTAPTHSSQLYSGPIQINQNETIHAIASAPTAASPCTDSPDASATFTVTLGDGGLGPVAFKPTSTTENNPFQVSLSEAATGSTICFTTDGTTTPTCSVVGGVPTCGAGSTTYNGAAGLNAPGSVSITTAITNATTGVATIMAVACADGAATTAAISQTYTLQVATPTMAGPAPGNLPFVAAGYNPSVSSATSAAQLRVATSGTVTCQTGTLLTNGNASTPINPGFPGLSGNTTYSVIGCAPGYAPSTATSYTYTVALNPPGLATAAGTYNAVFGAGFVPSNATALSATVPDAWTPSGINQNTPNTVFSAAAGLYYCASTTVTSPACGTTANTCTTGTAVQGPSAQTGLAEAIPVTATGTTVYVVACSPSFNASTVASAAYTLQLPPPAITEAATGGSPASELGCVNAGVGSTCFTTATGTTPATSYQVPAAGFPNGQPGIIETFGNASGLTAATGSDNEYAFACAIKGTGMTPVCAASSCTTGTSVSPTTGSVEFTGYPGTPITNGSGLTVAAGDTWTVVGCPGSTSAFLPSAPTTVSFTSTGQATPPTIAPVTSTVGNTVQALITNTDVNSTTICTQTSTTSTPPTIGACLSPTSCAAGATPHTGLTKAGSATVATVTITGGGSGYSGTSLPTVTIGAPAAGTQASATVPASAIAYGVASVTVPAPTSSSPTAANTQCPSDITVAFTAPTSGAPGSTTATGTVTVGGINNSITAINIVNPGSGYLASAPPTLVYTNPCTNTPATATVTLASTGSLIPTALLTLVNAGTGYAAAPTVTFSGTGTGATAVAALDDSFVLSFPATVAPAEVGSVAAVACGAETSPEATATYTFMMNKPDFTFGPVGSAVGDFDNATASVPEGAVFTISTTSTSAAAFICATTTGTAPNCTCNPGVGTTPITGTSGTVTITANATLQAIACDGNNFYAPSAVQTATLTTTLPAPTLVDAINSTTVTGGTYTNAPGVNIGNAADFPSTIVYCYTLAPNGGTAPACTPGATPVCVGSLVYTPGTAIPINVTGTTLQMIACSATETSPVGKETYTLNVAPVVVTDANTTLTCGETVSIGLDCSAGGGVCSTATANAGGPTATTPAVTICYSTTATLTDCSTGTGITCFSAGTNGLSQGTTSLAQAETISAVSCLVGSNTQTFNSTVSASPTLNYSSSTIFAPFTFTPTLDGSIGDWTTAASTEGSNTGGTATVLTTYEGSAVSKGYFGYDAGNYYFAYHNTGLAAAATTFVTFYLGDDSLTTGAGTTNTTTLIPPDNCATGGTTYSLATGINAEYAITVETDTNVATEWQFTNGAWTTTTFTVNVSPVTAGTWEIGVPKGGAGHIPSIAEPNFVGAAVTHAGNTNCTGANPVATADTWPQTQTAVAVSPNVHVTNASATVTFAIAGGVQTMAAGDLLVFASQPGVTYQLVGAVTTSTTATTTGTLTTAYTGTTNVATTASFIVPAVYGSFQSDNTTSCTSPNLATGDTQ